jgi:hypothetical protein
MIEYIKKLRACIKWLLDREDANLAEIGRLTGLIDAAEKHHTEAGKHFFIRHRATFAQLLIVLTESLWLSSSGSAGK